MKRERKNKLKRHLDNMGSVQALHRRTSYERVCLKIADFMAWARLAEADEGPPLAPHEADQLEHPIEVRDELREEMRAEGQEWWSLGKWTAQAEDQDEPARVHVLWAGVPE